MTNSFYNVSGNPSTGAPGTSATMRSEFLLVQAGFDKLPAFSPASAAVIVNAGGTAFTTTTGALALAGNFTTTGAFNTTLAQSASVTLTLPGSSQTLATLAGTEIFTNKTFDTAGAGNVFKINGTAISAVVGSGSVVLASGVLGSGSAVLTSAASDATKFLNGAASPAFAAVKESDLAFSDVTTNNASISTHGYLKKLSNVATDFMGGTGNWTSIPLAGRTITGTANEITVTNGDGVSGNPTLSLPSALTFTGKTVTGGTFASVTFSGTTAFPGSTAVDSSGKVGIGTTPSSILDILQSQNAESLLQLANAHVQTAAQSTIRATNGTSVGQLVQFGVGYTTSGVFRQNGTLLYGNGAGGLTITTGAAQPIYMAVNGTETAQFTATRFQSTLPVAANSGTAIPAGGTAGAGVTVSSATNFGVFFGSGAPTLSAAKGSLYLRSDGTGTGDRAYINSNGSTTWTALTTAA